MGQQMTGFGGGLLDEGRAGRRLLGSRSAAVALDGDVDQEGSGKQDESDMAVPAQVTAHFIVVESEGSSRRRRTTSQWRPSVVPACTRGRRAQSKRRSPLVPWLWESRCHSRIRNACWAMLATSLSRRPERVCTQTTSVEGTASA